MCLVKGRGTVPNESLAFGEDGNVPGDGQAAHIAAYWPTWRTLKSFIASDAKANPRNPKIKFVLVFLRFTQVAMRDRDRPSFVSLPLIAVYRFLTEVGLGLEIRPKTIIGPGLTIHHGYAVVVNNQCVIGSGVTLRQCVTLGHQMQGGGCPVIGDGVEFGSNAVAVGNITIGEGAKIGAGSVVTKSVPPRYVAVGNPAVSRPQRGLDGPT
ncbi:MAG: serine acetyltransferase [Alcaligenaceae bacterium]|nr:MAG: serine acetyltransferase [Alcaligenaceae bacterium]